KNWNGAAIAPTATQSNNVHQVTWAPDGKRIYVAGNTAGFYIVNTEAVAKNTNAALAEGTAGCNFDSTNVYANGVIRGRLDPGQNGAGADAQGLKRLNPQGRLRRSRDESAGQGGEHPRLVEARRPLAVRQRTAADQHRRLPQRHPGAWTPVQRREQHRRLSS